jgi:zinc protease
MKTFMRALIPSIGAISIVSAQAKPTPKKAAPALSLHATKLSTVEGITEYSLPNGLHVLLFPDQSKPTVTVNVTYLVGSRHEGYGEGGMAHLLEHMLFKGSTHHKNIPQELTDHGSRPNGSTLFDRTNYFETVPATDANLDWALDLEADRMVNSFVAKKDLESEFSVVRNEFELGENNPWLVSLQRTLAAAYRTHAYGKWPAGSKADIENVPIERLQVFYRKYYQPDNAVLVVAGKFDADKTLGMVEKKFGEVPRPQRSLEKGNLLFATYTVEAVQDGERFVTTRRVGDAQMVMAGYHVPAGAHPDFAVVSVLQHILTNNPSGRLYKALIDTKLAGTVDGNAFQLREPSLMLAWAEVRKEQSIDNARAAMEAALDATAKSTFSAEEVDRAKTDLLKDVELGLNNSEQVGYDLSEWAAMGDWRLLFLNRDRIAKVTPADVQRVAAAYLKPSNRTVAVYLPTDAPDRAEIPALSNVAAMVADYKGKAAVQAGEAFDASPTNIDARTTHSTLPNGAHLTLLPKQTRGNRVVSQIVLRVGTEQSLAGKVTSAQLVGSMLSRGTTSLTRQQVKDSLDKLKAQITITPGGNNVVTTIETVRDNFVPVLELVAQELRNPRFDSAEFDKLKQENITQLEQVKSEPIVQTQLTLLRKLMNKPKGHPLYVSTPEESIADMTAATLADAKAFHQQFYGASSADIAVIGDVEPATVTAAVTRLFGDWKSAQPFARIVRTYAPQDSTSVVIETPDKANAAFFAGQLLQLRDDQPDFAAMEIANFIIGGGLLNSRLVTRLRQKEGISYAAQSVLQVQALDPYGFFLAVAIYAPQNVDRVLRAFKEEMDRVRTEGFTAQEIDAAKSGYLQLRSQTRANDKELVGTLVSRRFAGRTMSYDTEFESRVRALTPEQVNAVAKKYLDPAHVIAVRGGDFKGHPPEKATP